ncbi:hypothetical protein Ddc_07568 [Ditylenchus destructor]|nr:hypothetical protein Ddc_07568 [Ditylenchus destructor]
MDNSEDDVSHRASVSLTDMTSRGSVGGSENVADLRKQIMTLQAEIAGCRKAIPIMIDSKGHDVTEQMQKLAEDLAKSHEIIEDWETRYANQEKEFYDFKKKTHEELTARENTIDRLRERAKTLEIDNEKLRKQLEDDESRIFHLQQQNQIGGENESLNMDDFNNQSVVSDSNLRQELAEKEDENVQLANRVAELQKTIDELRAVVNEQSKALKNVIVRDFDGQEDSLFGVALDNPTQYSGTDYVIAQMLGLLEQLEVNDRDSNTLRESIVKFLRDRGYDAENKNIAELAMSFRTAFKNRRKQIRATNDELANEYQQNNTELRRHLNQLSDDSLCSSVALSVQQTANESRALDMSRADILNKTADVTQNLTTVVSRMNVLRGVCSELFSKLQGTAEFLQNLLDGFDDEDDEGRDLMRKIKNIRLDLDKSMGEAMLLVDEVKKAEKSISEFQSIFGQTFDLNEADESQDQDEVQQIDADAIREEFRKEIDKLKGVEERNVSLQATLNQELKYKEEAQSRVISLEKQLDEIEEQLNEKTQELQVKLNEHEQREVHLQSTIEALNFSVHKLGGELDCKSQALLDAQNEHQHMRKCLDEARETVEIVRNQLSATQVKYDEVMEAMKKYSKDVQDKDHDIQEMEQKLECLREKLQFTESERDENVDRLEAKLNEERRRKIDLDKENESLQEKCYLLEKEVHQLRTELEHTNAIVEKGNDVLRQKLQEGLEDMDSSSIEEEDGEQVANFDDFVNFLSNCKDRADNLVQLMKKAEEMASTTNIKLPYCDNVLNELRLLRLMLYKIAKFFDANKENLGRNTKTFADKIKKELVNIHATLQDVASQNLAPMPRYSAKVKETGGQKLEKRKK